MQLSSSQHDSQGSSGIAQAALPHLKAGAAIINTTSVVAYKGKAVLLDYAATKGAITAFTRSLAQQLLPQVRHNCLHPLSCSAAAAPGADWRCSNDSNDKHKRPCVDAHNVHPTQDGMGDLALDPGRTEQTSHPPFLCWKGPWPD